MKKVIALAVLLVSGPIGLAQSGSGTVRGTVLDPSGAVIKGATVEIHNPVSQYDQTAQTDSEGRFEFDNVPLNNYHLAARRRDS